MDHLVFHSSYECQDVFFKQKHRTNIFKRVQEELLCLGLEGARGPALSASHPLVAQGPPQETSTRQRTQEQEAFCREGKGKGRS